MGVCVFFVRDVERREEKRTTRGDKKHYVNF